MSRFTSSPARGRFARLFTLLALVLAAAGILGTTGAAASTASVSLSCFPSTLDSGETTRCLSIVTTPSETPQGGVEFFTTGWGDFGKGFCLFQQVIGHQAFCNLPITGTVAGQQQIFAVYADRDEVEHEASTKLTVKGGTVNVFCTPEFLSVLETAECEAFVPSKPGGKNPTGLVQFSADIQGSLPLSAGEIDPSCPLEPTIGGSRCIVDFTPEIDGLDAVVARYAGDGSNPANNGSSLLLVSNKHETTTSLSCNPVNPVLNTTTECTATVTNLDPTGGAPTGEVQFERESNNGGTFPGPAFGFCELVPVEEKAPESSCSALFSPSKLVDQPVTATYKGTTKKRPAFEFSKGTVTIHPVPGHKTAAKVTCSQAKGGAAGVCTVTVSDTEAKPTVPLGTVMFHGGTARFSADRCQLSPGPAAGTAQCAVSYTMRAVENSVFFVEYLGNNLSHQPSQTTGVAEGR